jgi:putative integral membrane protein (TIGR02587 family)
MAQAAAEKQSLRPFWVGLGRALGGALVFTLPMLMTMEMWEFGFAMDRWRLLLLLALSLPMLMFLSHYSGFEATWGWKEDLRDVATALGVGAVVSAAVLWLFGIIDAGMPRSEIVGKIALQAVPGALGALLGRSQLGRDSAGGHGETYPGELVVMVVGALFLSLNVAPTEEMVLIAYRMDPVQTLLLPPLSLLVMHGFVFASEFKGSTPIPQETPWWSVFLRFTVVGYVVALLTSVYVLWTFGRFDGVGFDMALAISVVLAFPAAVGAAAARLIL